MNRTISLLLFAGALLSFSACSNTPTNQPPLGPVSATGTLIPAEVSLLRRGTHLFMIDGKKTYYVESKTENLVAVEGQTVHLEGIAEANTSKDDLPVLTITKLSSTKGESGLHLWNIPALDLQIKTPSSWNGSIQKNVVSFTLAGEETPLCIINFSETGSLPAAGKQLYIGGHRAVRIDSEAVTGISDVYVMDKDSVIHLHFDVTAQKSVEKLEDAKILQGEFEYAISTIKFLSDRTLTGTGSETGIENMCGGVGNIQCPKGSFCDINDVMNKTGQCRSFSH